MEEGVVEEGVVKRWREERMWKSEQHDCVESSI